MLVRLQQLLCLFVALAAGQTPVDSVRDWWQWGGPQRNFSAEAPVLDSSWDVGQGPLEVFRHELSGGHSAVTVAAGRIFVAHGRERVERVSALSESGQVLWEREHRVGYASGNASWDGPHAAPVVVGQTVTTVAIDATVRCWAVEDGRLLWQRDLGADHGVEVPQSGYAASPLVINGALLLPGLGKRAGGLSRTDAPGLGVLKLDLGTGKTIWQKESFPSSHASPVGLRIDGRELAVFHGMEKLVALDPVSGERLWSFDVRSGAADNVSFTPLWHAPTRTLYLSHAYDRLGAQALRLDARGSAPERLWNNTRLKVEHGNGALWDGMLLASHGGSPGFLVALDAATGELLWKRRFPKSTLLTVREQGVLILDEEGTVHLARPSRTGPDVAAKLDVLEELSWTVPTLVGRTLYLRSTDELVALRLP